MKSFNKRLIDKARSFYHKVYVVKETPEKYILDDKSYIGDEIWVYYTGWEYEEAIRLKSEEELKAYIEEDIAETMECLEA